MDEVATFEDMSGPERKRATYADLAALPENVVGELIDGELFAMPRPSADHSLGTSGLGTLLGAAFQFGLGGPGGWWILDEPELHFGEDVLVPDLAGWRTSRLARPSGPALTVAPDWICEALSPSTAALDRGAKLRVYAREGVAHAWLLDPLGHSLEVYERDGLQWRPLGSWSDQQRVRARPFEQVELFLGLLWPGGPLPLPTDR
jgi:Uma2 family endonuclease